LYHDGGNFLGFEAVVGEGQRVGAYLTTRWRPSGTATFHCNYLQNKRRLRYRARELCASLCCRRQKKSTPGKRMIAAATDY
jgi:hypothetical protein